MPARESFTKAIFVQTRVAIQARKRAVSSRFSDKVVLSCLYVLGSGGWLGDLHRKIQRQAGTHFWREAAAVHLCQIIPSHWRSKEAKHAAFAV